jgi:Skp family chaperone for outer membrane proteins
MEVRTMAQDSNSHENEMAKLQETIKDLEAKLSSQQKEIKDLEAKLSREEPVDTIKDISKQMRDENSKLIRGHMLAHVEQIRLISDIGNTFVKAISQSLSQSLEIPKEDD